ncbi:uncharacterized [Tachysurus ichikawai]
MLAQEYCRAISERAATLRQAKQQLQVRSASGAPVWHSGDRVSVGTEACHNKIGTQWPHLLSKEGGAARRKGPAGSITTYGHV